MNKPILVDLLHGGFNAFWQDTDQHELPRNLDWESFMRELYSVEVIATKREAEVWMDEKDLIWFRLKWGSDVRTSKA